MRALQQNPIGKLLAALLLLASTFLGCLYGVRVLTALPYMEAVSWQETPLFYNHLYRRQEALVSNWADRLTLDQDNSLSYVDRQQLEAQLEAFEAEMAADATWFRYQIRTQDGQEILATNLPEGQRLNEVVETIHYSSFIPGEYYFSQDFASYQIHVPTASGDTDLEVLTKGPAALFIECGVPVAVRDSLPDEFYHLSEDFNSNRNNFSGYFHGCLLFCVLAAAGLLYLLWSSGHKTGCEGIFLSWQEKVFFELYLAVMAALGTAAVVGILLLGDYFANYYYVQTHYSTAEDLFPMAASAASALGVVTMGTVTLTLRTLTVRLKAGCLLRSILVCRVIGAFWQGAKNLFQAIPFLWRSIAVFLGYFFLNVVLFQNARYHSLSGILWALLHTAALALLCWWSMSFRRLRKGSQAIASGNLSHQIDTQKMPHDLRAHADDLNNISHGMAEAVDEKMRSERFKAELITNVSHDLKTPLTSIINYVNLLKTTEQADPKAQEYIEVLDRKSQRLKKLTEDLVEASKASTGVLAIQRDKIGMAQLIDQALGEWEEKLEARSLTVVTALPEGETWVYADGRHLWRVIDNLLSNCSKYAMAGTRIYLDLIRGHGQIILSVKNISREPLNVPPERLMERFVRGEESRSTEGSGLGLSIARSLTELQGGTFDLVVDGDLFKAIVTLPQAN